MSIYTPRQEKRHERWVKFHAYLARKRKEREARRLKNEHLRDRELIQILVPRLARWAVAIAKLRYSMDRGTVGKVPFWHINLSKAVTRVGWTRQLPGHTRRLSRLFETKLQALKEDPQFADWIIGAEHSPVDGHIKYVTATPKPQPRST